MTDLSVVGGRGFREKGGSSMGVILVVPVLGLFRVCNEGLYTDDIGLPESLIMIIHSCDYTAILNPPLSPS